MHVAVQVHHLLKVSSARKAAAAELQIGTTLLSLDLPVEGKWDSYPRLQRPCGLRA